MLGVSLGKIIRVLGLLSLIILLLFIFGILSPVEIYLV